MFKMLGVWPDVAVGPDRMRIRVRDPSEASGSVRTTRAQRMGT